MNRFTVSILIILLLSSSYVSSSKAYPRHVDPSKLVLENPNPIQLFQLYRRIYGYINSSDYMTALDLLGSASDIIVPSGTQKVLNEYNSLLGSLINELNLSECEIKAAYEYLKWFREDWAEEALQVAEPHLEMANTSVKDIMISSVSLVRVLGGQEDLLLEGVTSISDMVERLNVDILEGYIQVENIKDAKLLGLSGTVIRLAVNESKPLVGSNVSIVGNLLDDEESGLDGKTVSVVIGGEVVYEALTGRGGFFSCNIEIPYIYDHGLIVYAEYWPVDADLRLYTPSVSNLIRLRIEYMTPAMSIDMPLTLYPGKNFTVNGVLSLESVPLEDFIVNIRYLGSLRSVSTDDDGCFTVNLVTPDQAEEGGSQIFFSSLPKGVVGPSSKAIRVNVVRDPLSLNLEKPWIVFSGLSAIVRGSVNSDGLPLEGCLINIYVGDKVVVTHTDVHGGFKFTEQASLFELSSSNDFTLVAQPEEPWISSISFTYSYLVINSLVALITPLAVLTYIFRRRGTVEQLVLKETSGFDAPKYKSEPSGFTGLYVRALRLVNDATGLLILPYDTLREYLHRVKPGLSKFAFRLFERISKIYENWLYSGSREKPPIRTTENMIERLRDRIEQDSS